MVNGDPDTTVILSTARTPIGRFNGSLATKTAPQLAGHAIKAALERAGLTGEQVSQVLLGQVLSAGVGQNPARQAAIAGGIPMQVPSLSINKVCLSGLTTIGMADSLLRGGAADVIVAGGMESMSRAPHLLPGSRTGHKYGDAVMLDHLAFDGLTDAYDNISMGESTEHHLAGSSITRADQDSFAAASHQRAAKAADKLAGEIAPIEVPAGRKETRTMDADEGIRADATAEGLGKLRPAFTKDGTITAASASQISDGAAALVLTTKRNAEAKGWSYVGEILSYATVAGPDNGLLHQPSNAIASALENTDHTVADLDVIEINEAFAAVALASAADLNLDLDQVNPNGGAIALGHPIGASGARLPITLLTELASRGGGIGAAALCGGGGQGDALIVRAAQ